MFGVLAALENGTKDLVIMMPDSLLIPLTPVTSNLPFVVSELHICHAICSSGESHGLSSIDPHFVGVETQAQRGELSNFLWVTSLVGSNSYLTQVMSCLESDVASSTERELPI